MPACRLKLNFRRHITRDHREIVRCDLCQSYVINGINHSPEECETIGRGGIQSGDKKQTAQWFALYAELFPSAPRPTHPFYSSRVTQPSHAADSTESISTSKAASDDTSSHHMTTPTQSLSTSLSVSISAKETTPVSARKKRDRIEDQEEVVLQQLESLKSAERLGRSHEPSEVRLKRLEQTYKSLIRLTDQMIPKHGSPGEDTAPIYAESSAEESQQRPQRKRKRSLSREKPPRGARRPAETKPILLPSASPPPGIISGLTEDTVVTDDEEFTHAVIRDVEPNVVVSKDFRSGKTGLNESSNNLAGMEFLSGFSSDHFLFNDFSYEFPIDMSNDVDWNNIRGEMEIFEGCDHQI